MDALLIAVVVIVIGLIAGKVSENRHLGSLGQREALFKDVQVTSLRQPTAPAAQPVPVLVCGEVVIASDAFKSWASGLRNLFGGEAKNFGRLYQRARREATLRMLAEARRQGYDAVCNVRHISTDIGGNAVRPQNKAAPMATCLAFGTAYKRT